MALNSRKRLFLAHYLDRSAPTFLNAEGAALAAGYAPNTARANGYKLQRDCEAEISRWMDESGLSKNRLFTKLLQLIEAKETKFFQKDGLVCETREVAALHIQLKALELAMRCKGMLDTEKQDKPLQPLPWSDD